MWPHFCSEHTLSLTFDLHFQFFGQGTRLFKHIKARSLFVLLPGYDLFSFSVQLYHYWQIGHYHAFLWFFLGPTHSEHASDLCWCCYALHFSLPISRLFPSLSNTYPLHFTVIPNIPIHPPKFYCSPLYTPIQIEKLKKRRDRQIKAYRKTGDEFYLSFADSLSKQLRKTISRQLKPTLMLWPIPLQTSSLKRLRNWQAKQPPKSLDFPTKREIAAYW